MTGRAKEVIPDYKSLPEILEEAIRHEEESHTY